MITTVEKGGSRMSFTGDSRIDDYWNKLIDKGTHGYDEDTKKLVLLKTPVKKPSEEEIIAKEKHLIEKYGDDDLVRDRFGNLVPKNKQEEEELDSAIAGLQDWDKEI
jgi:hypothetical protein